MFCWTTIRSSHHRRLEAISRFSRDAEGIDKLLAEAGGARYKSNHQLSAENVRSSRIADILTRHQVSKRGALALLIATTGSSLACLYFVSVLLVPVVVFTFLVLGYHRHRRRVMAQAMLFAEDYPSVLLAAASSIKAGMTPYQALKRSGNLLGEGSALKVEIGKLVASIDAGESRDRALAKFGASYAVPELELFRTAILLAMEYGGKFSPTLERLARITEDRITAIKQARVYTSNMRLTANIIILVVPFVVIVLSTRIPAFWQTLMNNPLASSLGLAGVMLIVINYLILQIISNFRP